TKESASLPPSYIRVLGMTDRGKALLKQMKTAARLPVIIKAADYRVDEIFEINRRAEDIFSLAAREPELRAGGRDILTPPVIL
ncbi:MAG: nucleotidyltransferase family protein, partial [Candidatus Ornithomonoglobus sp.]